MKPICPIFYGSGMTLVRSVNCTTEKFSLTSIKYTRKLCLEICENLCEKLSGLKNWCEFNICVGALLNMSRVKY